MRVLYVGVQDAEYHHYNYLLWIADELNDTNNQINHIAL